MMKFRGKALNPATDVNEKNKAETIIRVFREISGLDSVKSAPKLPKQNLPTFIRNGFTLVEGGGAEIENSKFE